MKLSELIEELTDMLMDTGDTEVSAPLIECIFTPSKDHNELRRAFLFKDKKTIKYLQRPGVE